LGDRKGIRLVKNFLLQNTFVRIKGEPVNPGFPGMWGDCCYRAFEKQSLMMLVKFGTDAGKQVARVAICLST